jgi:hypothetical protein
LKIVFLGEHFLDTSIIGAVLSIRGRETIIELWFNYQKVDIRKNYIWQKMKEIMGLDNSVVIYFKDNERSLKDKSTIKNAESYNLKFDNRKNTYY